MKTNRSTNPALRALRALARYETHGGYTWAAVMDDSELMCAPCVRANYRQIFHCTKHSIGNGWQVIGLANSGESELAEICCNCGNDLWGAQHEIRNP